MYQTFLLRGVGTGAKGGRPLSPNFQITRKIAHFPRANFSFCEEASFRKINISMVNKHNFKRKSKFAQSWSPIYLILALGFMYFEVCNNMCRTPFFALKVISKLMAPATKKCFIRPCNFTRRRYQQMQRETLLVM